MLLETTPVESWRVNSERLKKGEQEGISLGAMNSHVMLWVQNFEIWQIIHSSRGQFNGRQNHLRADHMGRCVKVSTLYSTSIQLKTRLITPWLPVMKS